MKWRTRKKRIARRWRNVRRLVVRLLGRHDRWAILARMGAPEMRPILDRIVYGAVLGRLGAGGERTWGLWAEKNQERHP